MAPALFFMLFRGPVEVFLPTNTNTQLKQKNCYFAPRDKHKQIKNPAIKFCLALTAWCKNTPEWDTKRYLFITFANYTLKCCCVASMCQSRKVKEKWDLRILEKKKKRKTIKKSVLQLSDCGRLAWTSQSRRARPFFHFFPLAISTAAIFQLRRTDNEPQVATATRPRGEVNKRLKGQLTWQILSWVAVIIASVQLRRDVKLGSGEKCTWQGRCVLSAFCLRRAFFFLKKGRHHYKMVHVNGMWHRRADEFECRRVAAWSVKNQKKKTFVALKNSRFH